MREPLLLLHATCPPAASSDLGGEESALTSCARLFGVQHSRTPPGGRRRRLCTHPRPPLHSFASASARISVCGELVGRQKKKLNCRASVEWTASRRACCLTARWVRSARRRRSELGARSDDAAPSRKRGRPGRGGAKLTAELRTCGSGDGSEERSRFTVLICNTHKLQHSTLYKPR